jgi:hypothetical protein
LTILKTEGGLMLSYRYNIPDKQPRSPKAAEPDPVIYADGIDWRAKYVSRRSPISITTTGRVQESPKTAPGHPGAATQEISMTARKTKKTATKKTAKSSTAAAKPKGPGVISTIVEMISRTEGASKDEILKILVKKFPERDPDGMSKTIIIQANRNKSSKETIEDRGIVYYNRRRSAHAGA